MKQRKVAICGIVFDYEDKAPYVTSGRSLQGALEIDESGEKVRCHECGRYYRHLAYHARKHGLTGRDYRLKHGMRQRTKLCSPIVASERARQRRNHVYRLPAAERLAKLQSPAVVRPLQRGPAIELRNLHNNCPAQLIARIRRIAADLGVTPDNEDLKRARVQPITAMRNLHAISIDEVMERCGLEPNFQRNEKGSCKYTEALLIELLRDAYVALGRPLRSKDCRPPLLPGVCYFQAFFGSWNEALVAAGLGLTVFAASKKGCRVPGSKRYFHESPSDRRGQAA